MVCATADQVVRVDDTILVDIAIRPQRSGQQVGSVKMIDELLKIDHRRPIVRIEIAEQERLCLRAAPEGKGKKNRKED